MSILDKIVTVNVSTKTMPLTTDAFDTILVLGDTKNTISVKGYNSLAAVINDYGTSDKEYKIANTIFSQSRRPAKILIGQTKSDKLVEGYQTIVKDEADFYGVVCTRKDLATQVLLAEAVAADTKLFGCSSNVITKEGEDEPLHVQLTATNLRRAFSVYANNPNEYPEAAILGLCLTYAAGSITWSMKELNDITGALLSDTDALKNANCNYVQKLAGRSIFMDGKLANGDFIDLLHGEDKLKNNIQVQVVNALLSNGKVPFTQQGLDIIESVLRTAVVSSANDGFLDRASIIVRMPNLAAIPEQDKTERTLKNVYIEAKYAGAIHKIGIEVSLNL